MKKFACQIPKSDMALENSRTLYNHLLSVIKNVQSRQTYNHHFGFACPSPPAAPCLNPLPHTRSLRGCVRCGPLYVTGWPSTYRLEFLPFFRCEEYNISRLRQKVIYKIDLDSFTIWRRSVASSENIKPTFGLGHKQRKQIRGFILLEQDLSPCQFKRT